ncbi:MAG: UDP-N-acetylmuramoyl-L-alanyl-D-glutamate--2,6-diaminopimelate ligase [Bacteroidetes bacterium]|nr:UDP-N-acetylmuramoyl-L-alanyl-D-glutamate--2,6-diaminopimelate ligase [Bacteroidota bacterium]MCL2302628.1 UDP-N-acetylmuramoyl-L-alanyl-D-glutamate--2,6-diaminopimelate ligase [Lentimicrobiaceae bacterium]
MKKLTNLLANINSIQIIGNDDILISNIQFDSRKVTEKNTLYVAQKGTQVDGHQFIDKAIAQGATAIVCEALPENMNKNCTYIQVKNAATALGELASAFYDFPSKKITLVGITGTNGKTTTVTLLYRLFMNLGYPTGLISTIVNKINNIEVPAIHTTPDALALNQLLNEMVKAGCEFCFMEVSSHAVVQQRIAGVHFAGGIFSNITHDHLDFHHTFANYIKAKQQFFKMLPNTAFALTNIDDKNGKVMVQSTKAKVYTYSLRTGASFKGKIIDNSFEGLTCEFNGTEVYLKLCGKFNAYNLLAIYGTALLLGLKEDEVLLALSKLEGADGRFQVLRDHRNRTFIVDYAHTPDALKNALSTIKDIIQNSAEVITVVGCGGDRDALKRSIMAETACALSNKVILTSDNPRTEDPHKILADMEAGIPVAFKQRALTIENRREAIKTACHLLPDNGVLIVAGKGHETYQEINGVRHHFDDVEEIGNNI